MRIIVDVDCVVADFVRAITEIYDPELLTLSKPKDWDWFRKINDETSKKVESHMRDERFWDSLPTISGAPEGVAHLRSHGHELVWCTMPYAECHGWYDARRRWLERHFGIHTYQEPLITISGGQKYMVKATTIIDDRVDFVESWEKANNSIGYVFASEMNTKYHRRYTWKDIINESFFKRKIL
jgi:5'(3')-deoxyribonucleotidase